MISPIYSLLHKHNLSAKVSIKLVRIYFRRGQRRPLRPNSHPRESDQQSPQNAPPYFTGATISFKQHQARESITNPGARHVPARVFRLRVLPCHHPARFITQIQALVQTKRRRKWLDRSQVPQKLCHLPRPQQ
jgi:hypothetical protein